MLQVLILLKLGRRCERLHMTWAEHGKVLTCASSRKAAPSMLHLVLVVPLPWLA